jgi:hypothetical protein
MIGRRAHAVLRASRTFVRAAIAAASQNADEIVCR